MAILPLRVPAGWRILHNALGPDEGEDARLIALDRGPLRLEAVQIPEGWRLAATWDDAEEAVEEGRDRGALVARLEQWLALPEAEQAPTVAALSESLAAPPPGPGPDERVKEALAALKEALQAKAEASGVEPKVDAFFENLGEGVRRTLASPEVKSALQDLSARFRAFARRGAPSEQDEDAEG